LNIVDLFRKGGWIMWPLLAASLLMLAIVIERLINLRPNSFLPPVITAKIDALMEARAFTRALAVCRQNPGVYSNIILTALEASPFGRNATREAIEGAGRREIPRVSRYLAGLSTIAAVSPLMGLLGTVLGMIQVFTVVAQEGLGQASSLSGGIAVALTTTAFGLIIAIPALIMYNIFSKRAPSGSRTSSWTSRAASSRSPTASSSPTAHRSRRSRRPSPASFPPPHGRRWRPEAEHEMPFPLPKRTEARIELSPLIDVIFQLLIFFVVTTTFLSDTGIPLELPDAETGQQERIEEELAVRISADGAIHFQGDLVSIADLESLMRAARDNSPEQAMTIYGDGSVDYETIVKVMDVGRRVGVPGIVLATEEPRPSP